MREALGDALHMTRNAATPWQLDAIAPIIDAELVRVMAGLVSEEMGRQDQAIREELLAAADDLEAKCMTEDVEDWHCPHDYAEWLRERANEGATNGDR